jgi:hypothetical protein
MPWAPSTAPPPRSSSLPPTPPVLFLGGSEQGEVREKWVKFFLWVDSNYVVGEGRAAWQMENLAGSSCTRALPLKQNLKVVLFKLKLSYSIKTGLKQYNFPCNKKYDLQVNKFDGFAKIC